MNSVKFLTAISHNIYCRTAQALGAKLNHKDCTCKLKKIELLRRKAGFRLSEMLADSEFKKTSKEFCGSCNPIINANFASAGEHVPRAEQNNRAIKERVRAACHQLPLQHLPRILVTYLAMNSARKLNFFPAKHGVSKHCSPRMMLRHENLDCQRDCAHVTGKHVQGNNEVKLANANEARALDCLYLRPAESAQNGHELLHIATNKVATCRKIMPNQLLIKLLP